MQAVRDLNGFTLIDILIATVIITLVSLGVATLTVGIIRGNSHSERLTTATALLQDRLEEVKRLGYSNVETAKGTENYGTIANFSGYKRATSVADAPPGSKMKKIDVIIYWDLDKHSAKASTILSE